MDEKKLNEELIKAWCEYKGYDDITINSIPSENFKAGFIKGVNCILSVLLINSFTDKEVKEIIDKSNDILEKIQYLNSRYKKALMLNVKLIDCEIL